MSGALRTVILLFSALRIQRWLLWGGGVVIVLGYLLPAPARSITVLGLVLALLPTLFGNGVLLRHFAAPRSRRLIPYARQQLLGGAALYVFAVATVSTLMGWTLKVPPSLLPVMWLSVAAATSVLMLTQFLVVTSAVGMTLWFFMIAVVAQSQTYAGTRELERWLGQNPWALVIVVLAVWCSFATWFLRVRSFSVPSTGNVFDHTVFMSRRPLKVRATQETALRAFLFKNPSTAYRYVTGAATAAFIALTYGFIFSSPGQGHTFAQGFTIAVGPTLGLAAYGGIGGWLVARQSKLLWLRGGLDRVGLFHLCEIQAWKALGAAALPMPLLIGIAWLLDHSTVFNNTVFLVFQLCAGACLLYYGLMRVRGWGAIDILCGIVLLAGWIAMFALAGSILKTPWLLPVISVATAAIALALRRVALQRWRRIDWLVCKPSRPPARDEVRLA